MIIIKFTETQITDNGRWLLLVIKGQSSLLATLLTPRNGVIYAEIAGNPASDDIVRIRVVDDLGFKKRAKKFGVSGLLPHQSAGNNIPTEEYLKALEEKGLSGILDSGRIYEVPKHIIKMARNDQPGEEVWNALADDFRSYCERGHFSPYISPDWISQTEAAELVGVNKSTINSAVSRGALSSWLDYREPNPQKGQRVSKEEVLRKYSSSKLGPSECEICRSPAEVVELGSDSALHRFLCQTCRKMED